MDGLGRWTRAWAIGAARFSAPSARGTRFGEGASRSRSIAVTQHVCTHGGGRGAEGAVAEEEASTMEGLGLHRTTGA